MASERTEAAAAGLPRYFTGRPCKHGHIAERRTSTSECMECAPARRSEWVRRNPEKIKAGAKRWREANPDKHVIIVQRWKKRHPEKTREMARANRQANPERGLVNGQNRRARKKLAGGSHSAADIEAIASAQRHRCAWCRIGLAKVQRHVDHIVPLVLGGSNDRRNLQLLCRACNLTKGAKHPIEFAQLEGRLL